VAKKTIFKMAAEDGGGRHLEFKKFLVT